MVEGLRRVVKLLLVAGVALPALYYFMLPSRLLIKMTMRLNMLHTAGIHEEVQPVLIVKPGSHEDKRLPPWIANIRTMANPLGQRRCDPAEHMYTSLAQALSAHASPDKVIILPSSVDKGYVGLALNFYAFNLYRLNITNAVFMCINVEACQILREYCIPSYLFTQFPNSSVSHGYLDPNFGLKANVKSEIVVQALELGYDVLLTDIDLAYLKNPLEHLPCPECDIQIQMNGPSELNSGFIFVRNTDNSLKAFKSAVHLSKQQPRLYHQPVINHVFRTLEYKKELKMATLPQAKWPAGEAYFKWVPKYHFYNQRQCGDCVIVHNNWIVGVAAKELRFREHLMWTADVDGYYSDTQRRYITYDNPLFFGDKGTKTHELSALRSALAIAVLLNRALIMPRFHCPEECPLSLVCNTDQFSRQFGNITRESTFLLNPMTNSDVILSQSPMLVIESGPVSRYPWILNASTLNVLGSHRLKPRNTVDGASEAELQEWLAKFSHYRVLRFHSLYDAFGEFADIAKQNAFTGRWEESLCEFQ